MDKSLTRIVIALVLVTGILTGCRASQQEQTTNPNVKIQLELDDNLTVGESSLVVILADADNTPINDATVEIRGDMNHAGMLPELTTVEGGNNGRYVLPFNWTMGGDWILTVTATLSDGSQAVEEFDVFNVSSNAPMAMGDGMVMLDTEPSPAVIENTTLVITVMQGDDNITDATVTVTATVNDINVEPIVITINEADDDGLYRAPMTFSQGGDWLLTVEANRADGDPITATFDLFDVRFMADCAPADAESTQEAGTECSLEMPTQSPLSFPGG